MIHLRLSLPIGLFTPDFPTKTLQAPPLAPTQITCPAHLIRLDLISRILMRTSHSAPNYAISSTPCYFILLGPKYLPQHPILQHPQPMFLPQCKRPSFTPIKKAKLELCVFQSKYVYCETTFVEIQFDAVSSVRRYQRFGRTCCLQPQGVRCQLLRNVRTQVPISLEKKNLLKDKQTKLRSTIRLRLLEEVQLHYFIVSASDELLTLWRRIFFFNFSTFCI